MARRRDIIKAKEDERVMLVRFDDAEWTAFFRLTAISMRVSSALTDRFHDPQTR